MNGARRTAPEVLPLLAALAACGPPPQPTEWHEGEGYRWRDLAVARRGRAGFTAIRPSRAGITFTNTALAEETLRNQHLHVGSGVALGDVDGDGLVDVYLASLEGPNKLYRNLGSWHFADVTDRAGVAAPNRYSTGAVFADVDGDGDLDLVVTALGGPNALFRNDGHGRFTDATEEAGLSSDRGSTTSTLADVDGDGDLDLYIANYKFADISELFADRDLTLERAARKIGDDQYEVIPELREHFRVEKIDGKWVRVPLADPDAFYLNDGSGRFQRVPFTSPWFRDASGGALPREPEDFGLAARFYDVDGDGDPDLYVCNDFETPDHFWINDGSGRFTALPPTALRTTSNASMSVDFADIDRDGDVDVYVADMLARERHDRHTHALAHPPPQGGRDILSRPQWQRNTLLLNRGDGTFAQVAEYAGVDASDWTWATLFLDVDLDGFEDILVANGYTWDVFHHDVTDSLRAQFPQLEWRDLRLLFPPMPQRNVAFRNNGDLTFTEVGAAWGFGEEPDISHGMAMADLDGDGDLDVVINRLGSPVRLLRNDATAPRVAVRLIGQPPNTQAIGAKIRVRATGLPDQEKEVTAGGLYLSGADQLTTFATGDAEAIAIAVQWRNGARTELREGRPNRLYEIREPAPADAEPARVRSRAPSPPQPYFVDVSDRLRHTHVDLPFNDFVRQPLLPYQLSHMGPGVTWYDVDEDGDEDLLIPSGRGGRLAYYRNEGARFTAHPVGLSEAEYDQTMVLAAPDRVGRVMLLVGQSNYEAATPQAALAVPAVLAVLVADGRPMPNPIEVAAGDRSGAGPLALADYDGDGDLDLFVGGRVIPAAYPAPATSRLYLNDGGTFRLDTLNQAALTAIGLVSAATFSDVDGDGDPDLVLALEWGPITLLENAGGTFRNATDRWGLGAYRSRWNGVATGDFDGDGRLDIVATSWGRNTRYHATADRPLLLYYGDFDLNRTVDILEAQFDQGMRAVVPLIPRARLVAALPHLRQRVPTYAAYAGATVEELLGPPTRQRFLLEANGLEHLVFLNRGGGFAAVPLPPEAQLAPAFHAGVADFDGDGHEDLFVAQNFFSTEIGTPRYDAGRGLWLRGDGTGGLEPVPGHVSGVEAYGEQRGAAVADFDGDGRIDIAVTQNGHATMLFRNVRGAPGLRVRLVGSGQNPHAVGAAVRLVYRERRGPVREVRAGTGYWSHDGPVMVLGMAERPAAVWVRWPGGMETTTSVPAGAREVTIRLPPSNP